MSPVARVLAACAELVALGELSGVSFRDGVLTLEGARLRRRDYNGMRGAMMPGR
jgi:hypothetical protein